MALTSKQLSTGPARTQVRKREKPNANTKGQTRHGIEPGPRNLDGGRKEALSSPSQLMLRNGQRRQRRCSSEDDEAVATVATAAAIATRSCILARLHTMCISRTRILSGFISTVRL